MEGAQQLVLDCTNQHNAASLTNLAKTQTDVLFTWNTSLIADLWL